MWNINVRFWILIFEGNVCSDWFLLLLQIYSKFPASMNLWSRPSEISCPIFTRHPVYDDRHNLPHNVLLYSSNGPWCLTHFFYYYRRQVECLKWMHTHCIGLSSIPIQLVGKAIPRLAQNKDPVKCLVKPQTKVHKLVLSVYLPTTMSLIPLASPLLLSHSPSPPAMRSASGPRRHSETTLLNLILKCINLPTGTKMAGLLYGLWVRREVISQFFCRNPVKLCAPSHYILHFKYWASVYKLTPTSRFDRLIVGFADKLFIVHQIEFVASVELAAAHRAGEALEVVDVILCSANYLCWWYALLAPSALCTVTTTQITMQLQYFTPLLRIDVEKRVFSSVFLIIIVSK